MAATTTRFLIMFASLLTAHRATSAPVSFTGLGFISGEGTRLCPKTVKRVHIVGIAG